MSIFYDSKTRAVKPWVYMVFLVVPIVLILIGIFSSQGAVKEMKKQEQAQSQEDVLDRF